MAGQGQAEGLGVGLATSFIFLSVESSESYIREIQRIGQGIAQAEEYPYEVVGFLRQDSKRMFNLRIARL